MIAVPVAPAPLCVRVTRPRVPESVDDEVIVKPEPVVRPFSTILNPTPVVRVADVTRFKTALVAAVAVWSIIVPWVVPVSADVDES